MASGNGKIVGVTDGLGGRGVYVTEDGRNWHEPRSGPRIWLKDVNFADGLFYAVGDGDVVFTSPDGENWTPHLTSQPFMTYYSIAHGNGAAVAVGYYGWSIVSTNLDRWTPLTNFVGSETIHVAFGNGRFVVDGPSRVWTSPDGFTWTEEPGPPNNLWHGDIAFSNGVFAMSVNDSQFGQIYVSADGSHWEKTISRGFKLVSMQTGFLGVNRGLWKSADAVTWQNILDYPGADQVYLTAAAQLNGFYVVGGSRGTLVVSTNGQDWEDVVKPVDYSRQKLAYGNGEFLLFGSGGVSVSADGTQWISIPNAPPLNSAVFGNGLWVGAMAGAKFATSTDAQTWMTNDAPFQVNRLQFANGLFLAEPTDGLIADALPSIAISSDGRSWRKVDFEGTTWIRVFGNVNGRWAGVIDGSRPVTSEDGEHWTVHPADPDIRARRLAAGNGRFLSVGGGGMGPAQPSWSLDGINWETTTQPASGATHIETSLTFGNGTFLLTDSYGNIYTSADGINWTGRREAEIPFLSAVYGNGRWLVASGDSILRSVDAPAATPITLGIQSNFSAWFVIVNGDVDDVFDIESAPDVNGPWTLHQKVFIGPDMRNGFPVDPSTGSRFFRAIASRP